MDTNEHGFMSQNSETQKGMKVKKPTPRSMGKELWTAGVEHRRKFDRYSDGQGWLGLPESQRQGWDGVAAYVMANFVRRAKRNRAKA